VYRLKFLASVENTVADSSFLMKIAAALAIVVACPVRFTTATRTIGANASLAQDSTELPIPFEA
jgi:hypothetical protein